MWEEKEFNNVEFIPEPTDNRIVSAADSATVGHQEGWRGEVMGWAPVPVPVVSRPRRTTQRVANVGIFLILILVFWAIWRSQLLFIEIPPPTSEWAFEDSGARELQDYGYTGDGIRVCMVDTGIDISHPDLEDTDLVFKDFFTGSSQPSDNGNLAHGTMMAGILVADGHMKGVAPGVTLGMAAALGDDGEGGNSGDQNVVASAIDWCWKTFDADIISLSLGEKVTLIQLEMAQQQMLLDRLLLMECMLLQQQVMMVAATMMEGLLLLPMSKKQSRLLRLMNQVRFGRVPLLVNRKIVTVK